MPIIAFANTKGGVGKSTLAAHFAASFEQAARQVSLVDLDFQQRSLTYFVSARRSLGVTGASSIALADIAFDPDLPISQRATAFQKRLKHVAADLSGAGHVVILDLPATGGGFIGLSLQIADILITPVNESMLDLATIEAMDGSVGALGRAVQTARRQREQDGLAPLQWAIVINRLSPLQSRNAERVRARLTELSARWGFAIAGGLTDRVAYRNLFDEGRTLIDSAAASEPSSPSTLRALEELSECFGSLGVQVTDGRTALDQLHAAASRQSDA